MNYFNSGHNYDKEVPKASYIFVLGLLIYLIDSPLLCMFTHMHIVLFSSHAYYMVNSKLSFQTLSIRGHTRKVGPRTLRCDPGPRTLSWDPKVGP